MANTTAAPAVSPAEVEAARAHKANVEKLRRLRKAALTKAGIATSEDKNLNDEQKARAEDAAEKHAGLSGKALADYIMEGKSTREVVEEAKASRKAADKVKSPTVRTSKDPEAAELAKAAAALAPEVKSAFLPKDAREFLTLMTATVEGSFTVVTRKGFDLSGVDGGDANGELTFKTSDLRKFAIKGEADKGTRAQLALLGKGTRLWGRKLGLTILAATAK